MCWRVDAWRMRLHAVSAWQAMMGLASRKVDVKLPYVQEGWVRALCQRGKGPQHVGDGLGGEGVHDARAVPPSCTRASR